MDPFSTAAAAVALIGQLDACSKSLRRFTRNLRTAKEEIKLLRLEVRSCREIAGLFYDAVAQYETTALQKAQEKNIDQQLREQSQLAHQQIRAILCRLGPLTKKRETSAFERIRAHVRWHFVKNDTCLPLATLGCVKGSLTLLGQVVLLDWFITNFSRIPESDSELKVQARSRMSVYTHWETLRR
ncbi:uncharacterized protein N7459_000334 [Penicillium hispanicum]|uniref:uncharacterized protein n=1 Tax=Penicillium hispanicum TaxID=1080232 RepID=UPI0025400CCE|nr:uncharacterized protein N7459_000334 [Penicillium hispanicum]KAJ5594126.1 hypothetical protein N7459_000334 [Penicillium hispanicum]